MGDGPQNALVHIDGKAATTAIEETSKGIGGFFRPWQIKRVAKAEAAAALIKAQSDIEISELQRRALHRFLEEEALHQSNMEAIAESAMLQLTDGADREKVDDDWMSNFFDKCRRVSNEQMQTLWSRVLAGEVNNPSAFSMRTVNLMSNLDHRDCEVFTKLCCFCWVFVGADSRSLIPLVIDPDRPIYRDNRISFASLTHLEDIGLINFASPNEYFVREKIAGRVRFSYFGTELHFDVPEGADTNLSMGRVMLTQVGKELARVAGGAPIPEFLEFVRARWPNLLSPGYDDRLANQPET